VVKHVDAAEVRIVVAAVLAAAADAVLVAHPIWLSNWPTCMCAISRGKLGWRQEARGKNNSTGAQQEIGDLNVFICAVAR
jgi:hypothetical protein